MICTSCATSKLKGIEVVKPTEATKSWNGDLLPSYPKGQPKVTVLKITIPP